MKKLLLLLCLLHPLALLSQLEDEGIPGKNFETVFLSQSKGEYQGTLSGLLIVGLEKNQILIDFLSTKSKLSIVPSFDEDSFYTYSANSTSNKTKVSFKWYVLANAFSIQLNGMLYEFDLIDGACDLVIDGLEYNFYQEPGTEYLTLLFTKPVRLFHLETEKYITVKPNSYLLFTIRHNLKPKKQK